MFPMKVETQLKLKQMNPCKVQLLHQILPSQNSSMFSQVTVKCVLTSLSHSVILRESFYDVELSVSVQQCKQTTVVNRIAIKATRTQTKCQMYRSPPNHILIKIQNTFRHTHDRVSIYTENIDHYYHQYFYFSIHNVKDMHKQKPTSGKQECYKSQNTLPSKNLSKQIRVRCFS